MTTWESQMEVLQAEFADQNPFEETIVHIGGRQLKAAVALSPEQKALGMTGRTYSDWEAMLFVNDSIDRATFHNAGVPQATHVATFDSDGVLLEQFTMAANDRSRFTVGAHKYALETPGDMGDFPASTRLSLTA